MRRLFMSDSVEKGHQIVPFKINSIPATDGKRTGEKEVITSLNLSRRAQPAHRSPFYLPVLASHEVQSVQPGRLIS